MHVYHDHNNLNTLYQLFYILEKGKFESLITKIKIFSFHGKFLLTATSFDSSTNNQIAYMSSIFGYNFVIKFEISCFAIP